MSTKERSPSDNSGEVESPFLDQELFVAKFEEEWEPRVAALVAESPFPDVAFEELPTSAVVPEVHEEGTEPEEEGVHEKEYEYERHDDAALEWEDPGCAGEQAPPDLEVEGFDFGDLDGIRRSDQVPGLGARGAHRSQKKATPAGLVPRRVEDAEEGAGNRHQHIARHRGGGGPPAGRGECGLGPSAASRGRGRAAHRPVDREQWPPQQSSSKRSLAAIFLRHGRLLRSITGRTRKAPERPTFQASG